MKYKFVGAREYAFIPEGETVEKTGVSIFVLEPAVSREGKIALGEVPVKLNVSVDAWHKLNADGSFTNGVGKMVDVEHDRFGKPAEIRFSGGISK